MLITTPCAPLCFSLLIALVARTAEPPAVAQAIQSTPNSTAEEEPGAAEAEPADSAEFDRLVADLEFAPDDPAKLDAVSRAAIEGGLSDEGLWFAKLASRAIEDKEAESTLFEALEQRIVETDVRMPLQQSALDTFGEELFRLGKAAMKRKLWANAVELFLACEGTAFEERASDQLKKIYGNKKAGEALIASGLDVPVVSKRSAKSAAKIERLNEKHSSFKDPHEIKGELYTIRTDMGIEFAESVELAMNQVNKYLRVMFQHKMRGKAMRRCAIDIYKSHDEFVEYNESYADKPGVLGYFSPSDNYIASWDPSTRGYPRSQIWETLFHEGTHQFASDVSKTLLPAWVEEGVACFSEGTRLMPNGLVVDNLVPDSRLSSLVEMLGPRPSGESAPPPARGDALVDIKEVITYYQPGSYQGLFYPWGWGLVYFMRNYEDENSERVYLSAFNDYVESYKGSGKHDVWERFLEYFIEEPERPGIESFDDFYGLWASWILELNSIEFGGPEQADDLIARGDVQIENGKHEYAAESYAWALRKRGGDPVAMYKLALANEELKRDDVAVFYLRHVLAWTDARGDKEEDVSGLDMTVAELAAKATEHIASIYEPLVEGTDEAIVEFESAVKALALEYSESGLARNGAQLLEDAMAIVGRRHGLHSQQRELFEEHGFELRRPRRFAISGQLDGYSGDKEEAFSGAGDSIVSELDGSLKMLSYDAIAPPDAFRFEATIDYEGSKSGAPGVFGVVLGSGFGTPKLIGYHTDGDIILAKVLDEVPTITDMLTERTNISSGESLELVLEVGLENFELFVNGESTGVQPIGFGEMRGNVGLFTQNSRATFKNLRLVY